MASTFVDGGDETNEGITIQVASPRSMRRTWSSNSPTSDHGGVSPKCVCAPATHAGSFKCRLHRVNSHSQSAPATPSSPQPAAGVSSASTRTVEAL